MESLIQLNRKVNRVNTRPVDRRYLGVDDFANYKYSLIGNTITINYPDYVYKGKVSFNNDTLILRNEENEVKYWKFKE